MNNILKLLLYLVSFPDPARGEWDWGLGMRLTLLRVMFGMLYVESKKGFVVYVQASCQRTCILLTRMFTNLDFTLSHTHTVQILSI